MSMHSIKILSYINCRTPCVTLYLKAIKYQKKIKLSQFIAEKQHLIQQELPQKRYMLE